MSRPKRFNKRPPKTTYVANEWQLDKGHPINEQDEHDDTVVDAIESLPYPYRDILEMRYYGRYTYKEIAEVIGWKDERWTATYLQRAKKKLLRRLSE